MKTDISISICVPAFNEEATLKEAVDDLLQNISPYVQKIEVIIVNDGSQDSTPEIAEQIANADSRVKIIHHDKNLGIGVCYRDALAVAQGAYFSWFPADHENSAEEFIRCLAYLGNDKLVMCHHRDKDPRVPLRRQVSYGYTWFLNKCLHLNLKYYNGLAIFPTPVLRSSHLIANGFFFSAEAITQGVNCGLHIIEISVPLKERKAGKSKLLTFKALIQFIRDILMAFLNRKEEAQ